MKHVCIVSILALCAAVAPLASCIEPNIGLPDARVIGYDGKNATPPDCERLTRDSLLLNGGVRRPSMQWGCATYTNLAAQLARPEDAVRPQTPGLADAAVAAIAANRYETGCVMPLDTTTTRNSR
ncbi:hypothetical protein BPMI_02722 [Candidatus Burkholderia pumila]|uniref:Lipoprotein n=1 Tax=Candidatus Burkholderia pumila TaxID=1090375 RepID=A0ABR5HMX3_9BURK|nr:hypothetical protein BPMI_02722 [Candidatus Burkholderia pumila]